MSLENVRYDAFISYRHCELDSFISENLHKKLESYKMPASVAKKLAPEKRKIERVFRDEAELPLSGNLSDPITIALDNSDFLIVICTPRLRESQWCLKEIETFVATHDREHVLLVLAEGEPDESFPEILLHEEKTVKDANGNDITVTVEREPLAADCRADNNRERLKKLDNVVIKLCAAIFGLNYDDLRQRHHERLVRRRITIASVAFAIVSVFAITCLFFTIRISRQSKVIADKYAGAMADASESLLSEGLVMDSVYSARSVLPEKSSDGYNADAYYSLCKALAPYEVANCYYPTGEHVSLKEMNDADVFPEMTDDEVPYDLLEEAGIYDADEALAISDGKVLYVYYEETSMMGDRYGTIASIDISSKEVMIERSVSDYGYYRLLHNADDHSLLLVSDRIAYMLDENLEDIDVITGYMECLCAFAYDSGFVLLDKTGTFYTAGFNSTDKKAFELYGHDAGTFVGHAVYDSENDRLMVHYVNGDDGVVYEERGQEEMISKEDADPKKLRDESFDSDDGKYTAEYSNDHSLHIIDSKTGDEIKTIYSFDMPLARECFVHLDEADVYIIMDKVFDADLNMIAPLPAGSLYGKDDDGESIYIASRFDPDELYKIRILSYEKMIKNADKFLDDYVPSEKIKSRYSMQ